MKDIKMGHIPCDNDEGTKGAKGAGAGKEVDGARGACDASVAVVAPGVKETGDCRRDARLGDAREAEVAVAGARKMEGKAAGEEMTRLEFRNQCSWGGTWTWPPLGPTPLD